uniref:Uncharacterized protein n=1 Tax=Ditylum brightwellii TaxID=49249 RepID=A0A7S2E8M0_9STRA|mmetsp:Transcript_194/g.304  ORF Transcript_194/g.304 Transcript_194/m.304 type:complete len:717 (+) Transcript_194:287-2437(+)
MKNLRSKNNNNSASIRAVASTPTPSLIVALLCIFVTSTTASSKTKASFVPAARRHCCNTNDNNAFFRLSSRSSQGKRGSTVTAGWVVGGSTTPASDSSRRIRMEDGMTLLRSSRRMSSTRLHLTYDENEDNDEDEEEDGLLENIYDDEEEDDDDEKEGEGNGLILDDMIDSISWLPSVHNFFDTSADSTKTSTRGSSNRRRMDLFSSSSLPQKKKEEKPKQITSIRKNAKIMPLFPFSSKDIHIPHSEHSLSIFEPRYIELFEHVLDSKRLDGEPEFAVTICHPMKDGVFAQYGVIFRVLDFMEVDSNGNSDDGDEDNMDVIVDFALNDLGGGDAAGGIMDEDGDMLDDIVGGSGGGGLSSSNSKVKYIAHHEVVGIVKIHQVLNPEDWKSKDTYLRVEASVVDDIIPAPSSTSLGLSDQEVKERVAAIRLGESLEYGGPLGSSPSSSKSSSSSVDDIVTLHDSFSELVTLQHDLNEDVKFSKSSVETFSQGVILASDSSKSSSSSQSFWITIMSWQQYTEQRILARHAELLSDFQDHLMDYLGPDAPESIDIADLPIYLREEATEVERRVKRELGPLRMELGLGLQTLLEARNHEGRIKILNTLIKTELQRLRTKKSMRAIFGDDDDDDDDESLTITSLNFDDDDADIDYDDVPMSIVERQITEEAALVEQMRDRLELSFGGNNDKQEKSVDESQSVERTSHQSVFFDDFGDAFQ